MEPIIKISHLNKSYKDVKAVNDLSFTVNRGELFAFLGVNGAGKSTTIHIICSQLSKDSGEVFIDGYNLDTQKESIKRKLGVVFQNSVLDKDLSVYDNLLYRGSLYGLSKKECQKRIETLSIQLQFKDYLNRSLSKLSGGQKRRIDVARALIHDPEILILDEPTTGLDPQTRNVLWSFIEYLRKEKGMTLFLTTHYMEEAASADSVVILDHGQIVASGSPLDLKNQYANDYITLYGVCEDKVKMLALPYEKIKDAYRIEIKNTRDATSLICQYPSLFVDYEITKGKMDDVFLNITGKKLEGERL
ncbi:MAG: ABC transporter ATP-binding protein [Floccifex porci]|uniref:ABC transporter ATP-binding protein n=1 Tax=Floccifex porci TaxID=2606629 RepID=UPI0023F46A10|nr:ABC transporter ATP-binding protein [Floccifex porci]MDD7466419.1 ABC transporter ATP-binding protein [Floccifex porci]